MNAGASDCAFHASFTLIGSLVRLRVHGRASMTLTQSDARQHYEHVHIHHLQTVARFRQTHLPILHKIRKMSVANVQRKANVKQKNNGRLLRMRPKSTAQKGTPSSPAPRSVAATNDIHLGHATGLIGLINKVKLCRLC